MLKTVAFKDIERKSDFFCIFAGKRSDQGSVPLITFFFTIYLLFAADPYFVEGGVFGLDA